MQDKKFEVTIDFSDGIRFVLFYGTEPNRKIFKLK
jgi:hypothetical protein